MDPRRIALGIVAVALSACEPEIVYEYVPISYATTETTSAVSSEIVPKTGGDQAAATFPIPNKNDARGELRVGSYGLVDIAPQKTDERATALHVRMTLTNDSDEPWTLDIREQRVELDYYGTSVPAFASADAGSQPPIVGVPPKKRRVVDLFFPLPTKLQKEENLPAFETLWRVHAGKAVVDGSASFDKIAVQPPTVVASYDYGPDYYWGPPYWYNPFYDGYGFYGSFVFSPFYFGYPLYIHHHDHYGHFHDGWRGHGDHYDHGHGPYGPPPRHPYNTYPRAYPHGVYPHGVTPSHGGYARPPTGGYTHGGAYPRGGYPHGVAPQPYYQQHRPVYPSGGGRGGAYHGAPVRGGGGGRR